MSKAFRSDSYRLVIEPSRGTSPMTWLWVERRRADVVWLPARVRRWWSAWTRISRRYRMRLEKDWQGRLGPSKGALGTRGWLAFQDSKGRRYVPLTEEEMHRMMQKIGDVQ